MQFKLVTVVNLTPQYADMKDSAGITPRILNVGNSCKCPSGSCHFHLGNSRRYILDGRQIGRLGAIAGLDL